MISAILHQSYSKVMPSTHKHSCHFLIPLHSDLPAINCSQIVVSHAPLDKVKNCWQIFAWIGFFWKKRHHCRIHIYMYLCLRSFSLSLSAFSSLPPSLSHTHTPTSLLMIATCQWMSHIFTAIRISFVSVFIKGFYIHSIQLFKQRFDL